MKIEKTGIKFNHRSGEATFSWQFQLEVEHWEFEFSNWPWSSLFILFFVVYIKETKMGKISKALFGSLFISSATANVFEVTGCNNETLNVSSRCCFSTLNKLSLALVLLKPIVKHQWSMDLEYRLPLDQYCTENVLLW